MRCYDRTRQTLDYFAKQLAQRFALREHYNADQASRFFVDKLDYDMILLNQAMKDNTYTSVEGSFVDL